MSLVSATTTDTAAPQTALLGIATPLMDLSFHTGQTGTVLAIVSVRSGAIGADLAPGATVRGSGSNTLWISGSAAQVDAKLAALTYTGTTAGLDDIDVTLIGAQAASFLNVRTPLNVLPLVTAADPATATVTITQGTLSLDTRIVDGPVIALYEPSGSHVATSAILVNSTIGAHSTLSVGNGNAPGAIVPRLAIAGRVELDGSTFFAGNGTAVTLAIGASLLNEGSMTIDAHAAQFTGTGRLVNDGVIQITGDGTSSAPVRIDTKLDGAGRIVLTGGATLALGNAVSTGETVVLDSGANTLRIANPASFGATIAGFSIGDRIVLDGVPATAAFYSRIADTADGTLTLLDGQHVIAALRFSAPEPGSAFRLGSDGAGNAMITLQNVAPAAAPVDVYRFFDLRNGTQLLTQGSAERDSILATRPDLRAEGVGLHAIAPDQADDATVAVYRFFSSTNGTHFMTADATERDTLLATRPDLVFEPTSTMFEHATARPGDVPVYRFFDQGTGAHFFTADAGERANVLATRPDMTSEGIAFYAPA